nr:MAG TPA: hypothetical protein [Caudoviricetes sp.]
MDVHYNTLPRITTDSSACHCRNQCRTSFACKNHVSYRHFTNDNRCSFMASLIEYSVTLT